MPADRGGQECGWRASQLLYIQLPTSGRFLQICLSIAESRLVSSPQNLLSSGMAYLELPNREAYK